MGKYEVKTKKTGASVVDFLDAVEPAEKRADVKTLDKLFRKVTGDKPKMWGSAIVGYGNYHYKGRSSEGDWMATGFSPRKANLTLYIMLGFGDYAALLQKLGKYTTGKGCLYIKRLNEIDPAVLEELVTRSYADLNRKYPPAKG
ncbi:MAG: DUF1801 domain-containing protein [Cucumibacter sp.]